jgi:hypothetical protein
MIFQARLSSSTDAVWLSAFAIPVLILKQDGSYYTKTFKAGGIIPR